MGTETLYPDALLVQNNLSGAVTDIDDDPDSPDGLWLTAISDNANSVCRASFPSPSGGLHNVQTFWVWARTSNAVNTCPYSIELFDAGVNRGEIGSGVLNSDTGQLIGATWDASGVDRHNVEIRITVTKTGGGTKTTGEIGAIKWDADYIVSIPVNASSDTLDTVGQSATLTISFNTTGTPQTLDTVGQTAMVGVGTVFPAVSELLTVAGQTTDVDLNVFINPVSDVLDTTGQTAALTYDVGVAAISSTLSAAGQNAAVIESVDVEITGASQLITAYGRQAFVFSGVLEGSEVTYVYAEDRTSEVPAVARNVDVYNAFERYMTVRKESRTVYAYTYEYE